MLRIKLLISLIALSIFSATPAFAEPHISKSSIQKIISVPLTKQSNEYTCGAAAALSILMHFGDESLESEVAKELNTQPKIGTYYKKMVQFFQNKGYQIEPQENMSLETLKEHLMQEKPVLCLIQAWEDNVSDYANYWGIGHYVVAIGYDENRIYFMDPWVIGNYAYLPIDEFMNRWHQLTHENVRLHQWGMAISKGKAQFNPDDVVFIP